MKIILCLLISFVAGAQVLIKKNNNTYNVIKQKFDIKEFFVDYGKIKNINIIFSEDVVGKTFLYGKKEIKKEELDFFASIIADENGYTMVVRKHLNQIEIISTRDVRYKTNSLYSDIKNVPFNYNHVKFTMKLEYALANEVTRNMRPFMSRYGRIIDERNANTIIISDTARNIHRLYKLIKVLDKPAYVSRKLANEKFNTKHAFKKIKKESILNVLKDQHVLFIIAFSILGGIIGFGIANSLNRKKMEW